MNKICYESLAFQKIENPEENNLSQISRTKMLLLKIVVPTPLDFLN